ncbi:MAG: Type secretion system rane protein PorP/SprF family [Sphingobacteriales bacterium]|nr:Type secretion system rane protein PorP/SprF family [Sphingobacteriales bacterium]
MKKFFFILLQVLCLQVCAQQKSLFSQYMFNPLIINPAYSAIDNSLNITTVARQQWVGFKGAPNTQTLSIHSPIKKKSNTSVGLMAFRDQIGESISETGAFITLAQRIKLNDETYFAVGFNGGLSQYSASYSSTGTPLDVNSDPAFLDQNTKRINLGLGLMFFSDKFYAGISSPFLYTSDIGSNTQKTKNTPTFMLQGGYLFDLGENFKLKPNALVKYISGSPVQVDLNMNFLIKEIVWLGASYRTMDSVDFLTELNLTKNLSLGYSYDHSTTKLSEAHSGSHEVMLNVRFSLASGGITRCYF